MKLIGKLIYSHIGMFLTAVLFLTLEAACDLLQPTLMSQVVDEGVKLGNSRTVLFYGGMMLLVAGLGAVGAVMRNICSSRTSQLIGMELRSRLYRKVQSLSFENIDRFQTSSLITRITNDVTQIQNFINGSMRILVKAPITCGGAVFLIITRTPKLAPAMAVILSIVACLIYMNMKIGFPRFRRMQEKLDALNQVSREFFSSIRVIKAFCSEEQEESRFGHAAEELEMAGISALRTAAVCAPLINLTVNMGIVFLLWRAGRSPWNGIGRLMAAVNYMTQMVVSLGMVSNILNTAVRACASADRVQEVLEERPAQNSEEPAGKSELEMEPLKGYVEFRNVSFTYAGTGRPMLRHISFQAEPGETIGIIGPTGSGKTTLIRLIPRFYDASFGQVLLDGKCVNDIPPKALNHAVAVVPQKALLFTGTIESNLRWGKETAAMGELEAAAKVACAHEFIDRMELGYGTKVGQGGVNLSGGQKQRLSIARALLKDAPVLILDDCTSALDAFTEKKVLEGIGHLRGEKTIFLISQRVSTVMRADRILCLKEGFLAGFGTHEELLAQCAEYREMYISQMGGV